MSEIYHVRARGYIAAITKSLSIDSENIHEMDITFDVPYTRYYNVQINDTTHAVSVEHCANGEYSVTVEAQPSMFNANGSIHYLGVTPNQSTQSQPEPDARTLETIKQARKEIEELNTLTISLSQGTNESGQPMLSMVATATGTRIERNAFCEIIPEYRLLDNPLENHSELEAIRQWVERSTFRAYRIQFEDSATYRAMLDRDNAWQAAIQPARDAFYQQLEESRQRSTARAKRRAQRRQAQRQTA